MTKEEVYQELVKKRKSCYLCRDFGMRNQAEFPNFDTQEIGNLTTWSNNLYSKILIVAQDFYHQDGFLAQRGQVQFRYNLDESSAPKDYSTKTNYFLKKFIDELPKEYRLSPPRNDNFSSNNPLFMTNATLCLKSGKASSKINNECYDRCGNMFLKPTIDILKPDLKIIINSSCDL
ncbi:hypothetical protein [Haliscomenobacter hydrossis]|uniref:Uncharacterized protein n=1 Tax=Haliscomenobacter hydrossis (strain ATCC 27775 / DSM 1100 / LMG 10767 / O) TaxID=760192 RepID=F4KVH8_HALH1|nr:hypothetical protein [Haliscomenobacter hydrossis]AEE51291.1 hypothetical protein Halhy_3435 [Haliscomenobacter hydrossis DSM 1100]